MNKKLTLNILLAIGVMTSLSACNSGTSNSQTSSQNKSLQLSSNGLTGSSCDSVPIWDVTKAYSTAGTLVVLNNKEYKNNWWTQGDNPETNNGISGSGKPWTLITDCGVAPTPTPTPTPSPTPTVTPTPNPTITPVPSDNCPATSPVYPTGRNSYVSGTIVKATDSNFYKCNSGVAAWCNSSAEWAYAPGSGSATSSAWTLQICK